MVSFGVVVTSGSPSLVSGVAVTLSVTSLSVVLLSVTSALVSSLVSVSLSFKMSGSVSPVSESVSPENVTSESVT